MSSRLELDDIESELVELANMVCRTSFNIPDAVGVLGLRSALKLASTAQLLPRPPSPLWVNPPSWPGMLIGPGISPVCQGWNPSAAPALSAQ